MEKEVNGYEGWNTDAATKDATNDAEATVNAARVSVSTELRLISAKFILSLISYNNLNLIWLFSLLLASVYNNI